MDAFGCCRSWVLALGLALHVNRAAAEPAAELTWLVGSGNVRPGPDAAPPPWETLHGFRSGRDNRARLTLSAERAGTLPGVGTSALLRVDASLRDVGQGSQLYVRDASSWLKASWQSGGAGQLSVRAFPLDTDYLRLGHLHALDWGGTDVARRESVFLRQTGGVPGAELSWLTPRLRLFAFVKSATVEDGARGPRRLWGAAAGGRFALSPALRLDVGFGFFQRPPTALEGASVRLVWRRGAFEPELAAEPFRAPSFRDDPERLAAEPRPGLAMGVEGVALVSRQRRYETLAPSQLVSTFAPGAALYGSFRRAGWAVHLVLSARSLPFVLHTEPAISVEEALPARSRSLPELGGWVGGSFTAASLGLVPSVELGARSPAALQVTSSVPGVWQTFVAGGAAGLSPLPPGAARRPLLAARLALRFQASSLLSLSALLEYQRDPNRARLLTSPSGVIRGFEPSGSLQALGAVQARF